MGKKRDYTKYSKGVNVPAEYIETEVSVNPIETTEEVVLPVEVENETVVEQEAEDEKESRKNHVRSNHALDHLIQRRLLGRSHENA